MGSPRPAREQLERELADLRRQLAELTARQNAGGGSGTPSSGQDAGDRKRVEDLIRVEAELAKALSATGELDEGLRLCLEASLGASGMDCGGIYLVQEVPGAFDLVYHQGLPDCFIEDASHYDADSPHARLVMAGKPVYTQYPQLGVPLDTVEKREALRAIAVIPIRHDGRVIGCLNVASHRLDEVPAFARGALEAIAAEIGSAITRLKAEEAFQASEQHLRSVFRAAPTGIGVVIDRVMQQVNERMCEMTGYAEEELVGQNARMLYPTDEEYERVGRRKYEQIRDHGTGTLETRWRRKDGRIIDVLLSSTVMDPGDLSKGVTFTALDITERKQTEQALRESEDKYRTLVRHTPAVLWTSDQGGHTSFISSNVEQVYGYTPKEILSAGARLWFGRIHPEDIAGVKAAYAALTERGEPFEIEYRIQRQDGDWIWLHDRATRSHEVDGTLRVDGVFLDVTERRRAEEQRDRLEEQLRQAQKMEAVGQLAGGIAHDFNNILTTILGNAQLLKMALPAAGDQAKSADEIVAGARRAADLTGQLLAFARKGKREVTPVDVHDLIARTVSMLTRTIDRRIEIRLELNASRGAVMGDPTQLQNAMLNLGVNARDAMPDGGVLTYATRTVTLARADCNQHPYELTPGDFLEIRVTDTGTGMDEQTQQRIFEPFFTTKGVGKGTGLGLAGVYGCVRSHDGSVGVASEPGRGAAFTILLPLAPPGAAPTPRTAAAEPPVKGAGHVLVVDDEKGLRDFVCISLSWLGYTVSAAPDGAAAVEYYRRNHNEIDLVILDLVMPKMDGRDAFREMKKIDPNVRVLVSSGFSQSQATCRMLREGALALLNKPYQITELSQAVAQHIRPDPP